MMMMTMMVMMMMMMMIMMMMFFFAQDIARWGPPKGISDEDMNTTTIIWEIRGLTHKKG